MVKKILLLCLASLLLAPLWAQDAELARLIGERDRIRKEATAVEAKIETRKLEIVQIDLQATGLPASHPAKK